MVGKIGKKNEHFISSASRNDSIRLLIQVTVGCKRSDLIFPVEE